MFSLLYAVDCHDFLFSKVPAALIAIVGYLETIAVGGKMATETLGWKSFRKLAPRKRYKYDANQE